VDEGATLLKHLAFCLHSKVSDLPIASTLCRAVVVCNEACTHAGGGVCSLQGGQLLVSQPPAAVALLCSLGWAPVLGTGWHIQGCTSATPAACASGMTHNSLQLHRKWQASN
jgi:hypothetical protein